MIVWLLNYTIAETKFKVASWAGATFLDKNPKIFANYIFIKLFLHIKVEKKVGFWPKLDIQELGTRINTGFVNIRSMDKNVLKSGQKTQIFDQTWISTKCFSHFCPNFLVSTHFYFLKSGQKMTKND